LPGDAIPINLTRTGTLKGLISAVEGQLGWSDLEGGARL